MAWAVAGRYVGKHCLRICLLLSAGCGSEQPTNKINSFVLSRFVFKERDDPRTLLIAKMEEEEEEKAE
jgi:hypothetical protein